MAQQLPTREYESAGGVVVDSTHGYVLVLERPNRMGPDQRPEVRLPKGHIEPDESPVQTALREVREEAGLSDLRIVCGLGQQTVEFDWQGYHYIRRESYFLLTLPPHAVPGMPEEQFQRLWLPWEEALSRLTFEAEREWLRRAQVAWDRELQDVSDQHSQKTDDHSQVKE